MSEKEGGSWPSMGVVVPVYNEEATVERGLRAICEAAGRYRGRCVVIAVNDGSADASSAILDRLAGELEALEAVHHASNQGYGGALRTGARRARQAGLGYAAFIDSDLTNPPEDLLAMGRLAAEGHPYVKASRFAPGGSMAAVPVRRRAVSRLGNEVAARLFGARIRDVTNGFRAVELDRWARWRLHERGFAIIVEELDWALRDGLEIVELPSVLSARTREQRASAFPYSAALIRSYLRYPVRRFARRTLTPRRR